MSDEDKRPGRRSEPRVWLYTEHWIFGSSRSELEPDERSVWIDFLCLGIVGMGKVDITYPEQVAGQLRISLELFERSLIKFEKYGKILKKTKKSEKKTYAFILNWKRYQPDYLHARPLKSTKKTRSAKGTLSDAHVAHREERMEGDGIEGNKMEGDGIGQDESEDHPKKIFLNILREFSKSHLYPFNEDDDGHMFDYYSKESPDVNLIEELRKKLRRWEERPEELRGANDPRTKLFEWFGKEVTFQEGRGKREFGEE